MLAIQVAAAIEGARPSQLDDISQMIWKGLAADLLGAEEAQELAEAVEARRALGKTLQGAKKPEQRRVGSRPRSAASLERRRRWVAAGLLPPDVAASFTAGESAALSVIAVEVEKRGKCELVIGAIAATAGVGETTVRNALRRARQLGLLLVEERRLSWTRNLPNRVSIICPAWGAWLRLGSRRGGGGCKRVLPTPTSSYRNRFAPFEKARKLAGRRVPGSASGHHPRSRSQP